MNMIQNKTFDMERALYGSRDIIVQDCSFDGPADGESALKECSDVQAERCFFNLRYPFWHNHGLEIHGSEMTELCRAAIWYSDHITITDTKLYGIKALRECADVKMKNCDIISPEFGWSVRGIDMEDCTAQSEYFMMRSTDLCFKNVQMKASIPSNTLKTPFLRTVFLIQRTHFGMPKTLWFVTASSKVSIWRGTVRTLYLRTVEL